MESMQRALWWEKLPQLLQFLSSKVKEAQGALKPSGELISESLKEKLPLLSQRWDDVVGFLVGKLEVVLPAAASSEALRILAQLVLATILLYLSLVFLGYCLNGAFNAIVFVTSNVTKAFTYSLKGAFKIVTSPAALFRRCCCFFFRGAGKTMKAPGRKGLRIPRDTFEVDPKRYFLDLRANAPMEAPSKKL